MNEERIDSVLFVSNLEPSYFTLMLPFYLKTNNSDFCFFSLEDGPYFHTR